MTDPLCAEYAHATARGQAHYGQICKEQQRRIKKTEYCRRRFKKPSDGISPRKSTKKIHDVQTAKFSCLSERP
jgi:hypothetical protein